MPRDESLTATPHLDISAEQLLELLTVEDVAALLKAARVGSTSTRARGAPKSDRLPHVKIGKYVRFDPNLLRAFLERRTAGR